MRPLIRRIGRKRVRIQDLVAHQTARLLKKIVIGGSLLLAVVYGGDYAVFALRHEPTGTVAVRRYYAIQEKANRVEYVFDQERNQTCARALFPHRGYVPCWYLSRHAEQRVDE
jgi:hypothetical protein